MKNYGYFVGGGGGGGCDQSPVRLSAVDFLSRGREQVLPSDTDQDESEHEADHDKNKSESG